MKDNQLERLEGMREEMAKKCNQVVYPDTGGTIAWAEAKGLRFDSGHEASEIMKLVLLDEKHLIFGLRLQVKFPLQGGTSYTCDACYLEFADGRLEIVVADAKGYKGIKEYKIKKKLFKEMYGIEIREL